MTIVLTVIAVIAVITGTLLVARRSFKTNGRLARRVMKVLLRSRKVRVALGADGMEGLLDGELSPGALQKVLETNPELVEKMAAEHGVDVGDVRSSLAQFSKLSAGEQQGLIERAKEAADSGQSPEQLRAQLQAAGARPARNRTPSDSRAVQKRKQKARAARKNAKRTRAR